MKNRVINIIEDDRQVHIILRDYLLSRLADSSLKINSFFDLESFINSYDTSEKNSIYIIDFHLGEDRYNGFDIYEYIKKKK